MAFSQLRRVRPGDQMRAEDVNQIIDWIGHFIAGSTIANGKIDLHGISTFPAGGGRGGGETQSLLKITGFTTPLVLGGAWYWALAQTRNATAFNPETKFAAATYYQDASATPVLLHNEFEQDFDGHSLRTNSFVRAIQAGSAKPSNEIAYTVYRVYEPLPTLPSSLQRNRMPKVSDDMGTIIWDYPSFHS